MIAEGRSNSGRRTRIEGPVNGVVFEDLIILMGSATAVLCGDGGVAPNDDIVVEMGIRTAGLKREELAVTEDIPVHLEGRARVLGRMLVFDTCSGVGCVVGRRSLVDQAVMDFNTPRAGEEDHVGGVPGGYATSVSGLAVVVVVENAVVDPHVPGPAAIKARAIVVVASGVVKDLAIVNGDIRAAADFDTAPFTARSPAHAKSGDLDPVGMLKHDAVALVTRVKQGMVSRVGKDADGLGLVAAIRYEIVAVDTHERRSPAHIGGPLVVAGSMDFADGSVHDVDGVAGRKLAVVGGSPVASVGEDVAECFPRLSIRKPGRIVVPIRRVNVVGCPAQTGSAQPDAQQQPQGPGMNNCGDSIKVHVTKHG